VRGGESIRLENLATRGGASVEAGPTMSDGRLERWVARNLLRRNRADGNARKRQRAGKNLGAMNQGRNGQTGANLTADPVWSARAGKRIHGR
jgi:hypothetical protein